jgi:hypothetical protein
MRKLLENIIIHLLFLTAIVVFVWLVLGFVLTLGGIK